MTTQPFSCRASWNLSHVSFFSVSLDVHVHVHTLWISFGCRCPKVFFGGKDASSSRATSSGGILELGVSAESGSNGGVDSDGDVGDDSSGWLADLDLDLSPALRRYPITPLPIHPIPISHPSLNPGLVRSRSRSCAGKVALVRRGPSTVTRYLASIDLHTLRLVYCNPFLDTRLTPHSLTLHLNAFTSPYSTVLYS